MASIHSLCGFELVTLFLAHPLMGYQIDITMSSGAYRIWL
jgi:hypothetical protein